MILLSRKATLLQLCAVIAVGLHTAFSSSSSSDLPASTATTMTGGGDPLLLRAARGEDVERTPVWMMRQAGRHMQAYRDLVPQYPTFRERSENPALSRRISLQPLEAYGVDGVILFSDILTPLPSMGIDFAISEGGNIIIAPIRDDIAFKTRLKRLQSTADYHRHVPFVRTVLRALRQQQQQQQEKAVVPASSSSSPASSYTVIGFVGLPYTLATYVVEGKTGTASGFLEMAHMIQQNPILLHDILSTLAHNIATYACFQIENGAQVLQVFDSWAGHLNDTQYDIFAAPYQKQVIAQIKKRYPHTPIIIYMAPGKYSTGGHRIARLAETGADIISIDHTVDIAVAHSLLDAANETGNPSIGLQGNLDPQILREGPFEKIKNETEAILEKMMTAAAAAGSTRQRCHIMNLGHGIDPNTPEEHAAFFVKTVQNYQKGRAQS